MCKRWWKGTAVLRQGLVCVSGRIYTHRAIRRHGQLLIARPPSSNHSCPVLTHCRAVHALQTNCLPRLPGDPHLLHVVARHTPRFAASCRHFCHVVSLILASSTVTYAKQPIHDQIGHWLKSGCCRVSVSARADADRPLHGRGRRNIPTRTEVSSALGQSPIATWLTPSPG